MISNFPSPPVGGQFLHFFFFFFFFFFWWFPQSTQCAAGEKRRLLKRFFKASAAVTFTSTLHILCVAEHVVSCKATSIISTIFFFFFFFFFYLRSTISTGHCCTFCRTQFWQFIAVSKLNPLDESHPRSAQRLNDAFGDGINWFEEFQKNVFFTFKRTVEFWRERKNLKEFRFPPSPPPRLQNPRKEPKEHSTRKCIDLIVSKYDVWMKTSVGSELTD